MIGCTCCATFGLGGLTRRSLLRGATLATMLAGHDALAAGPFDQVLGGLVSPEQERQLGEQAFAQIKQKATPSRDPTLRRRLMQVATRVVPASRSALPLKDWEFVVFKGNQVNAFALPGGKVGFFEGIFKLFGDDAQLATVLGHEVGHVNARHTAQRLGANTASQLGAGLLAQVLGLDPSTLADRALMEIFGAGLQFGVMLPYGRQQELEADQLGLGYMAAAGYDPAEAISFWEKMARAGGPKPPEFLSTHPADVQRIRQLELELPQARRVFASGRQPRSLIQPPR